MFASLVAQMVKNLPSMQEVQVNSLGQEDPLRSEEPRLNSSHRLTSRMPSSA